jgi:hypothetical protein
MKKIIRLTESDLARIVRRVIKENENKVTGSGTKEDPYKLAVYYDEAKKERYSSWDVYDLKVMYDFVSFKFDEPAIASQSGKFNCNSSVVTVGGYPPDHKLYFSNDANVIFQKKCDEYATTGSKPLDMTESRRYRRRVIKEDDNSLPDINKLIQCAKESGINILNIPNGCKPTILKPVPDPQTCINAIVEKLGEKATEFATCAGIEIPDMEMGPMSESRRYRRRF